VTAWDRPFYRARREQPPPTFDLPTSILQHVTPVAEDRVRPGQRVAVLVGSSGISRLLSIGGVAFLETSERP